LGSNVVLGY